MGIHHKFLLGCTHGSFMRVPTPSLPPQQTTSPHTSLLRLSFDALWVISCTQFPGNKVHWIQRVLHLNRHAQDCALGRMFSLESYGHWPEYKLHWKQWDLSCVQTIPLKHTQFTVVCRSQKCNSQQGLNKVQCSEFLEEKKVLWMSFKGTVCRQPCFWGYA